MAGHIFLPKLNLPSNTGTSSSSAGFIPPRSNHGESDALHKPDEYFYSGYRLRLYLSSGLPTPINTASRFAIVHLYSYSTRFVQDNYLALFSNYVYYSYIAFDSRLTFYYIIIIA